jgi:hypothetical protein
MCSVHATAITNSKDYELPSRHCDIFLSSSPALDPERIIENEFALLAGETETYRICLLRGRSSHD